MLKSMGAGAKGRGYAVQKGALLKRLRRIEGQVRSVERMVGEDRYCIDIVTQLTAIQAALDKVALGLLAEHAAHCLTDSSDLTEAERSAELMDAVGRLLRHG
jgi:CsoR family transcriptional regulator, copper-sensing transcriptional repressor